MEALRKELSRRTIVIGSVIPIAMVCLLGVVGIQLTATKLDLAQQMAEKNRSLRWIRDVLGRADEPIDTQRIAQLSAPKQLGTLRPATLYRSTNDGERNRAFRWVEEGGYNGPIELAVATTDNGLITNLLVVGQNETPGFGDIVQDPEHHWIIGFRGRSLANPPRDRWLLSADGGMIDGLSGATITTSAIVNGVVNALRFLSDANGDENEFER